MQEQQQAVGVVERLAVHAYVGRCNLLRDISGGLAPDRDAAGCYPVAGFAARAVAEIGKKLVETAHGTNDSRQRGAKMKQKESPGCGGRRGPT